MGGRSWGLVSVSKPAVLSPSACVTPLVPACSLHAAAAQHTGDTQLQRRLASAHPLAMGGPARGDCWPPRCGRLGLAAAWLSSLGAFWSAEPPCSTGLVSSALTSNMTALHDHY